MRIRIYEYFAKKEKSILNSLINHPELFKDENIRKKTSFEKTIKDDLIWIKNKYYRYNKNRAGGEIARRLLKVCWSGILYMSSLNNWNGTPAEVEKRKIQFFNELNYEIESQCPGYGTPAVYWGIMSVVG